MEKFLNDTNYVNEKLLLIFKKFLKALIQLFQTRIIVLHASDEVIP